MACRQMFVSAPPLRGFEVARATFSGGRQCPLPSTILIQTRCPSDTGILALSSGDAPWSTFLVRPAFWRGGEAAASSIKVGITQGEDGERKSRQLGRSAEGDRSRELASSVEERVPCRGVCVKSCPYTGPTPASVDMVSIFVGLVGLLRPRRIATTLFRASVSPPAHQPQRHTPRQLFCHDPWIALR